MDKNENVVVAIFEDRAAAEAAIDKLKKWDKASDDIKLGAIGLLYKENGQVKSVINRQSERGLKVGALVGVIGGVLTGGLGLIGGAAVGGLAGGTLGTFFTKSLHLNEAECNALGMELDMGKAAVVVTCDEYELVPTQRTLEHAGSVTKVYLVPAEAVAEAATHIQQETLTERAIAERSLDDALTRAADDMGGMI